MLKSTYASLAIAVGLLNCTAKNAVAQTYTDSFEGASLSPFWTVTGPGTAVLTNAFAHSGVQSLQTSTVSTSPWSVDVLTISAQTRLDRFRFTSITSSLMA
jgi:hypothetical protein